jgi:hypothetical protein
MHHQAKGHGELHARAPGAAVSCGCGEEGIDQASGVPAAPCLAHSIRASKGGGRMNGFGKCAVRQTSHMPELL